MAFSVNELGGLLPKREEGLSALSRIAEPEPEASFLWKALDIANRPYSATMGAVTGLLGGETGPLENVRQGLMGERSFSALDAAGTLGADTTDPKTQWMAVAADVVNPLDPLTYTTLGFNKAGRVARGVALADKMGDASKATRATAAAAGNWSPVSFAGLPLVPKSVAVKAAGGMDVLAEKADRFTKTNRVLKHFGGLRRVDRDNPDLVTALRDLKGAASLDESRYTAAMAKAVDGLRKAGNDEVQVRAKMTEVFDLLESPATRLNRIQQELDMIDGAGWQGPLLPWKGEDEVAQEVASFTEDQAKVAARKVEIDEAVKQPAKQPWEMTREEYALKSTTVGKDDSIYVYHISGSERHGGQAEVGQRYVTTDLNFAETFAAPDSQIEVIRVPRKALKPSPEGSRRGANLYQEALIDEVDILERHTASVGANSFQEARDKIKKPHRLFIESALQSGKPVPPAVLADYPDLAAKYAPQPDARQSALKTAAQNLAAIEGKAEPVVSEGQARAFGNLVGEQRVLSDVLVDPADPAPQDFMMRRRAKLEGDLELAKTLREGVAPDTLNMADELAIWREQMQSHYDVLRKYDKNFKFPIEDYMPHILAHSATKRERAIMQEAASKESARRVELAGQGFSDDIIERKLAEEFRNERAFLGTQMTGETLRGEIPAANRRKYSVTAKESRALRAAGEYVPEWNENAAVVLDNANMQATRWRLAHDAHEKLVEMGQTVTRDDYLKLDVSKQRDYVQMDFNVPWVDASKNPFRDRYMTREAYDLMQRELGAAKHFTGRAGQSALMQTLHKIRHQYVSWTLGPFPATHARNFASDMVQNFMGGLDPLKDMAAAPGGDSSYMTALAIAARNAHTPLMDSNKGFADLGLSKLLETVNGKFGTQLDADGLLAEMRKRRVLGDNHLRDDMELAIQDSLLMQEARKGRSGLAKISDWINPNADKNKLVQTGFKVGSKTQDYTRSAMFVHALKEGLQDADNLDTAMTYAEAQVRKHLFDYGDLTSFERDVMRLAVPFYTFTSKNLPLQIEKTLTDPGRQAWVNRAFQGMWAQNEETDELNYEDLPEWMQNSMAIPIRKLKDKDGNEVWSVSTLRGWLPQTELNELADAVRGEKFLGFFAERLNPAFKEFFEQTMNYDSFLGRQIDEGQTVEMFGKEVHPRVAHLVRNLRIINEMDKMNPMGLWTSIWEQRGWLKSLPGEPAAREGSGRPHRREAPGIDRTVRQLTGLNFYTADAERESVRKLNDAMREIGKKKSQARLAERFGQTRERDSIIEEIEAMKEEARAAQRRVNQLRRNKAQKQMRETTP